MTILMYVLRTFVLIGLVLCIFKWIEMNKTIKGLYKLDEDKPMPKDVSEKLLRNNNFLMVAITLTGIATMAIIILR